MLTIKTISKKLNNLYYNDGFQGQKGVSGITRYLISKFAYWYKKTTFQPYIITKELVGETIKIKISNLFTEGWYANHIAWTELDWIGKNMLAKGDIVADCGANNGTLSVFFSKKIGASGKTFAFEPIPANIEDIKENTKLNKIQNLQLIPKAVGNKSTTIAMLNQSNGMQPMFAGGTKEVQINVAVTTLDEYFSDFTPTFIKIDVEGFELEVLKGAKRILLSHPKLAIEVHSCYHENDPQFLEDILALVSPSFYHLHFQLIESIDDGIIIPYNEKIHTFQYLAKYNIIHLFAMPKN
jgi:FkbM family methyltransferase